MMATCAREQPHDEQTEPFAWLTDELARACQTTLNLSMPAGDDLICSNGSLLSGLIVAGWALRYVNCSRSPHIVDILLPGELTGMLPAAAASRFHPVRCLTDVEIIPLHPEDVTRLMQRHPAVAIRLDQMRLEEEYRTQTRMMVLARHRPTARLCHLMLNVRERLLRSSGTAGSRFPFPLTYRQLSDLIGASRSQVAASLSELRDRGWASLSGGWLSIIDVGGMTAACEFDLCSGQSAYAGNEALYNVQADGSAFLWDKKAAASAKGDRSIFSFG